MMTKGIQSPIVTIILSILMAVTTGAVFINFLSTTMEKYSFGVVLGILLAIAWVLGSGKYWWLAFPFMAFWGGVFWIGFKIYPDEIGVLIVAVALILALIKGHRAIAQDRPPISWAFLLLISYFILHMSISLYIAKLDLLSGGGSIVRVYATGFTYLLFSWLYYKFGSSKYIKAAIIIIFAVITIRIIISLFYFYQPTLFNLPEADLIWLYPSADLRFSALYQMIFSIMLLYLLKNPLMKTIIVIFIILMFVLVLLGEGRVSVIMAVFALILWLLLAKKIRLLIYLLPVLFVSIIIVLSEMHLLSSLPLEMQRAISFIPGLESQLIYNTEASNYWHFDLFRLGFERWASDFFSLLFGNSVDPVGVYELLKLDYFSKLQIAASTARYESTLWTVLATLGIVGTSLYIWIFRFLFREIIPIVWKDGIISFKHTVYAVAIICLLLMILFSWIRGGFPTIELLLGVMAKALYEDNKWKHMNLEVRKK
jgi:hypothetical protein